MAERESIEAAKAIERKQKKDQRDWDSALLVEERLLKKQEKIEKDKKKGYKNWPSNKKRKQRRNRKRKKRKENKQMPHPP
jgi:hypothetical protein